MTEFNPGERRIFARIGEKEYVPYVGWEWGDAYLPLGGLFAGMILGIHLISGPLTLIGPFFGLFVGFIILRASPSHVPATTWIKDMWRYALRPKEIYSASANSDSEVRNSGGLKNLTPFKPDSRTEDLTDIKRAWPGAGAVLRTDGMIEGIIEIEPPNMDFAPEGSWASNQQTGKRHANEELPSHPELKLHGTTEPFRIEELQERLDSRLADATVQERPVLRELIEELRDYRPQKMDERGTQQIRCFTVVSVAPEEATTKYQGEPTPGEKLYTTPLVGPLFRLIGHLTGLGPNESQSYTESELHQEMIEALHERMDTIENELFGNMNGFDTRQLSTAEVFSWGARFWNGNKEAHREVEGILREQPISRAAKDGEDDLGNRLGGALPLAIPGPKIGPAIPPGLWNTFFGWLPNAESVSTPTPVPVLPVVGGIVLLLLVATALRSIRGNSATENEEIREANLSGILEEHRRQSGVEDETDPSIGAETGPGDTAAGQGRTIGELGERHKNLLAAPQINEDRREPEVGGQFTKTLTVTEMPDWPRDGFLSDLFTVTDAEFDFTIYFEPRHQDRAREDIKDHADDLKAEAQTDGSSRAGYLAGEAEKAQLTSDAVQSGQRVFDMSMYVTVRGDTREELQQNERRLRKVLTQGDKKKKVDVAVFPGKQDLALRSASPLGPDRMGQHDPDRFRHVAIAGAVGCVFSSLHNPTFMEETGFEIGLHKETKVPVMMDPAKREGGHAYGIIGHPGAGKSRSGKSNFIEYVGKRDDTIGVVIEPLGNWRGVIESARVDTPDELQAEHIVVGGDQGLNPMEIKETPERILRAEGEGFDPLGERKSDVIRFVQNFLSLRGMELDEQRELLENAVDEAYAEAGITSDPNTHDRESPTLLDLIRRIALRVQHPEEFITVSKSEADSIKENALWLLRRLSVFIPDDADIDLPDTEADEENENLSDEVQDAIDIGDSEQEKRYTNFAQESTIDLHGSDIVYLDLARTENSMDDKAILTLQTLISQVYELCKTVEEKVVIPMDEFHYLLDEDRMDLGFMDLLFRHMRHHDIFPWIMTQGLEEFTEHPEGKSILDMLTVKQFHAIRQLDEDWADELDMDDEVLEAVKDLQAGSEEVGYSPAVVDIEGEWREVHVKTPPKQTQVIEWESKEQPVTDLPGVSEDSVHDAERRDSPAAIEQEPKAAADGGERTTESN